MEFARAISSNGIEQRNESAEGIRRGNLPRGDAAWSDLNFRSFGFAEGPLEKLNGPPSAVCCTSAFGVDAACFQASAIVKISFIYLTNQYFSGCRMLQSGYRFSGFHHIFAARSRLA
jgi:hypothetical protein